MSKDFLYKSALAPYMDMLIKIKRSISRSVQQLKYTLKEIDDFAIAWKLESPCISEDLINDWQKSQTGNKTSTIYSKYQVWRELALLMGRHGCKCYIPRLPKNKPSSFAPHIFNSEEIAMIFEESNKLKRGKGYINASLICIPIILRLLYSTGMRISEATTLKNEDVCLDKCYIHLKKTKNGHERLVPLGDEIITELRKFEGFRNKMSIKRITHPDSPYFIRPDRLPITSDVVGNYFRTILETCGIPFHGDKKGPRMHDLRHTFAVHSMLQMVNQDMDLYTCLPILSAALGHRTLRATEKYVRLTQAMYPEVERKTSGIDAIIYNVILD